MRIILSVVLATLAATVLLYVVGDDPAVQAQGNVSDGGFGFHCTQAAKGMFDPIVYPKRKMAGHRHVFWGNTSISSRSTHKSLMHSGANCEFLDGSNGGNHSSYWAPDLLLPNGKYAGIASVNTYYHSGSLGRKEVSKMQPFPAGLKLIADGSVPQADAGWSCHIGGDLASLSHQPRNCSGRSQVSFIMHFPNCGNGKADSADHMSHVVYPVRGKCPASHPQVYPELIPIVHYDTSAGEGAKLASGDVWKTLHSDYLEAWERDKLARWIAQCNKSFVNCKHQP